MSKITKLHPKRSPDSDLFDAALGEVAVEEGFKLPETEEELEAYEHRLAAENNQSCLSFHTIHEALTHAEGTPSVRYTIRESSVSQGSYKMAARNATDEIDDETLSMMDAAADEDDD